MKISENRTLVMDSPGALMLKMEKENIKEITVSDPSRKLGRMHFSISGKTGFDSNEKLQSNFDHTMGLTHISVLLPQEDYAGESVSINLQ